MNNGTQKAYTGTIKKKGKRYVVVYDNGKEYDIKTKIITEKLSKHE